MLRRLHNLLQNFRRDERGQVLVEMTLITPLMISLSAGVFEFSNLIHRKLLIEAGLRDAARYAARCNESLFTGASLTIDCDGNAVNIAIYGNISGTGQQRVADWDTSMVTVDMDHGIYASKDSGGNTVYRSSEANVYVVRADGTYNYAGIALLSYLGIGPITLTAAHEERVVRW